MGSLKILGVRIDKVDFEGAVSRVLSFLETDGAKSVFTPNSEIIYRAKDDEEFKNVLNSSELNTADGIGVVYASRILKSPVACRVAGYDLACRLLPVMNERKLKLFLFGGKEGVALKAKEEILKKYPDIDICGVENGYFTDDTHIINHINEKEPHFVFVCLGAPKQENWIHKNKERLNAKVLMGIGGSLDVFAGTAKRAPEFFIKLNIEWLYRLIKNPSRIGRMMALPKFGIAVIKSKRGNKNA
ncbi:MAG: WecB/TagA/CpsF family glycosyltransferase [Ruminococcaceae bacterium]|nr:WecB/TagA/CpsF family glycosyltransferase [Oscillospiraceae bacterium]